MNNLRYSYALVSLAKTVDTADVAATGVEYFFDDMENDDPERYNCPSEYSAWARSHNENLRATLPGLKTIFLEALRRETPGVQIETNSFGDALAPEPVLQLLKPVTASWFAYPQSRDLTTVDLELPAKVKMPADGERIILFDGDGYVVPASINDSMIEVWFRRTFYGNHGDREVYSLYLTKRAYGWQAYGLER